MACDEGRAVRLRGRFADSYDIDEKEMFGGIALCFTDICAAES